MPILREYLCPATLAEAVDLRAAYGPRAALLAGGASLIGDLEAGRRAQVEVVIDLSRLALDSIRATETYLVLGATATLTDVLENEVARAVASGLLWQAARNEGPLNYRNAATVGGIVAGAAGDSEFYAALLALGATVSTTDAGEPQPLASVVHVAGIITAVHVPLTQARGGLARVARTPADRPIVAALAVVTLEATRVAYCGLSERPILEGADAPLYSDFRGSAAYRAALAPILRARVLRQLLITNY